MTLTRRQFKTRQILMNATVTMIIEKGYNKVTVTDITESVDYGRWTFYQYFKNKDDAILQAIMTWMDEVDAYVIANVQQYESPRREYEAWHLIFEALEQQMDFMQKVAAGFQMDLLFQVKAYIIEQFSQHLMDGFYKLMDGVRPEIAARLHVASALELIEYWVHHPELDSDTITTEFFTFMFNHPPTKYDTSVNNHTV